MSFLQSPAWGTFQKTQGRQIISRNGDGWRYQAILEHGTGNTRAYTPYGPIADSAAAFDAALTALEQDAKQHGTTFVRIEPTFPISDSELRARGYRKVTYNQLQPAHTQLIDLSQDEDAIIAQMSQNTRNLYRNHHKKGIAIHKSHNPEDIEILLTFLRQVAQRNRITPHSDAYFKAQAKALLPNKAATLFYATLGDTPIAASLMYDSDDTRTYAHAAADDTYRKYSAGTALLAYAIIDAKHAGKTTFDLYGIAPENEPNHPWAGFTKFKKSFGGKSVAYPGAWDKPLKPLRYHIYRCYQSLRRALKKRRK